MLLIRNITRCPLKIHSIHLWIICTERTLSYLLINVGNHQSYSCLYSNNAVSARNFHGKFPADEFADRNICSLYNERGGYSCLASVPRRDYVQWAIYVYVAHVTTSRAKCMAYHVANVSSSSCINQQATVKNRRCVLRTMSMDGRSIVFTDEDDLRASKALLIEAYTAIINTYPTLKSARIHASTHAISVHIERVR